MGRRALQPGEAGEPTVRTRNGGPVAYVRWRDRHGRYHETSAPGRTPAAATKRVLERAQEAMRAANEANADRTLDAVATEWLDGLVQRRRVRPSTAAQYRATWRGTLSPVVGRLSVNAITRAEAQRALDGLVRRDRHGEPLLDSEGRTRPLVGRQPRQVLLMLLTYAADRGYRHDGQNVLAGTEVPRRPKPSPRALTDDEWGQLLGLAESAARRHHRADWNLVHLLTLLRYTGVRINEALGLMWADVDFKATPPTVRVERTLLEPREGVCSLTGPTKGGDRRVIALHEDAEWMLLNRASWVSAPGPAPDAFVFATGRQGKPLSAANARARLRALVRGTDLEWVHPHSLRHTVATRVAEATGSEVAAADVLGHADGGVTASRHYIDRGDGVQVLDPRIGFPRSEG